MGSEKNDGQWIGGVCMCVCVCVCVVNKNGWQKYRMFQIKKTQNFCDCQVQGMTTEVGS